MSVYWLRCVGGMGGEWVDGLDQGQEGGVVLCRCEV